ncbi:MAG TPA: class I SAM-dependent methyltransferase [Solirubrobacteraceae bacterium]|nr:class I SAM-dependent methyltransferase [Solirubrobacteraceae bacterium]
MKVALFHWRAHRLALRLGDSFSLTSATRPRDLAKLIELAHSRKCVVELGTGTAWTAISLALANRACKVVSYDPIERPERDFYIRLVGLSVRDRVELIVAPGADGGAGGDQPVDMLYIDSSHACQETIREVRAWQPALADDALLVFDDFTHPLYPGVREAVAQLGLGGQQHGSLFVHRAVPSAAERRG